jgi:hypothetical protein
MDVTSHPNLYPPAVLGHPRGSSDDSARRGGFQGPSGALTTGHYIAVLAALEALVLRANRHLARAEGKAHTVRSVSDSLAKYELTGGT